jgi:hypothetical protein
MKTFFVPAILILGLHLGASAFAAAASGGDKAVPAQKISSLHPFSTAQNATTCNAWTTCADGSTISCWADGDNCTWNWVGGVSVTCTGDGGTWYYTCN